MTALSGHRYAKKWNWGPRWPHQNLLDILLELELGNEDSLSSIIKRQ